LLGQKYDVIVNTVELLKKYQNQLEILQKKSEDSIIKKFNINEVCLEMERKTLN